MKERASKSLGGSCMSKFLEESERKRIQRLHNVKSSFHGGLEKKRNVARKPKRIPPRQKNDNTREDFQLNNLCSRSETTRSGLKISIQSCEKKFDDFEARKNNAAEANKNIRLKVRNFTEKGKQSEGKENCSPGTKHELGNSKERKASKEKSLKSSSTVPIRRNQNIPHKSKEVLRKAPKQQNGYVKPTYNSLMNRTAHTAYPFAKTNKGQDTMKHNKKTYLERAVTIDTLRKEKNQAESLLKELDERNLIGKMREMQLSADVLNSQRREFHDFENVQREESPDDEQLCNNSFQESIHSEISKSECSSYFSDFSSDHDYHKISSSSVKSVSSDKGHNCDSSDSHDELSDTYSSGYESEYDENDDYYDEY